MADPTVAHADAADATFSATGATNWNKNHVLTGLLNADSPTFAGLTLTGLTSGRVAIVGTGGVIEDDAGLLYNKTTDLLTSGALALGAGTSSAPSIYLGADTTCGWYRNGANSWTWLTAATPAFSLNLAQNAAVIYGTWGYKWGVTDAVSSSDTGQYRGGPNQIVFGGGISASSATSRAEINKSVTAFTDGVAKATFTVTIPNASHNATLEVEVTGICGAGGAIGAGEASATNTYKFNISRTAGVNAVVGVSAAYGAAASNVAGGTTITATAAASAISGAVGATNTFTVDVTITKGGGSSDNHVALMYGKLMNANASGISIA